MSQDMGMTYELMDEMEATFKRSADTLEDTNQEVRQIAAALENGGLIGVGGDAFCDILHSILMAKITELQEKMIELAGDIRKNKILMQQADSETQVDVMD